ncbi:MAK10-like protein [Tanacetum coccineum]
MEWLGLVEGYNDWTISRYMGQECTLCEVLAIKVGIGLSIDRFNKTIDQSAGGKLHDRNPEESWALLEDLALYDSESWNDLRDFSKPVKAIALPQDVSSTFDRRLIELENQYCMEDPEQAFVEYASSHTDEAGEGLVSNFMESQDARLSKFKADFKQQQSEMTNKIDIVLKAITGRIAGALPSDTVKYPKLSTSPVLSARSKRFPNKLVATQDGDRNATTEELEPTLEDEFQGLYLNLPVLKVLAHALIYNAILDKYVESLELGKNRSAFVQGEVLAKIEDPKLFTLPLNNGLLEETDLIFGLVDGTKSYTVGIVKDVEVYIGKLKLLNDFYVIDMKKDPETPLLVGRGFLATANAVIDCRMANIAVGEGITRSVFGVKGVDLGEEEAPYWTTLGKKESYKPRPRSNGVGAQTPYYAKNDFLDCHLPGE